MMKIKQKNFYFCIIVLLNLWFKEYSGAAVCMYFIYKVSFKTLNILQRNICQSIFNSNSPLPQCSVNIIPQDQIDDEPIGFTTPIPPSCNQAIIATLTIIVSTTLYISHYFLTMNSLMLSSKLTALETKMYGKMMVIKSYFKEKLQSLKKSLCI